MRKYNKLFSLIALLIFNSTPSFATENLITKQQNTIFTERELNETDFVEKIDLISGDINIEFFTDQEKIVASTNLVLKNSTNKEISKVFFILNSGLNIENIEINNSKIKEVIKEKSNETDPLGYVIFLENPLLPNKSVNLKINYSGKIFSKYKFGRIKENDIFLTSQTFFYPRFEKSQKVMSNISLNVTVPNEYTVISQSEDFNLKKQGNKLIFSSNINNLNGLNNDNGINLASAKYNVYKSNNISIYYRDKTDKSLLEYMTKFETSAISSLTNIFGKHDYKKFNIVEVNREDLGGMATSNTIFISDKNFGDYKNKSKLHYEYFKKQNNNDENKVNDDFKYYLRNTLAHESSHLFFNYFYTYDSPWFGEGFPEFISLKILDDFGVNNDLKRKIEDYEKSINSLKDNVLPPLNEAFLNSSAGYILNYYGTPLTIYKIWESQGNNFWTKLNSLLKDDFYLGKTITYNDFKNKFELQNDITSIFEKEFKYKQ